MEIIIGCESSGVVREAFRRRGHNVYSCDLLPADDGSPYHIQDDIFNALRRHWDMAILHPPCTYVSNSGIHWNHRTPGREEKTAAAIEFVDRLWRVPIKKMAIENPMGVLSTRWKPYSQRFQPNWFGDDASKWTCLWLRGLLPLRRTVFAAPRFVKVEGGGNSEMLFPEMAGVARWANQTDSGQNKLSPSPDRWKERSRTYPGPAEAMAAQWG